MINTGTYIGMGCNIFGGGFQNKYIPSFTWGSKNNKIDLEKLIITCKKVLDRRGKKLLKEDEYFIRHLYKQKKSKRLAPNIL